MSLFENQTALESLIDTGSDSQTNLFDVTFIPSVYNTTSILTSLVSGGLSLLSDLTGAGGDVSRTLFSVRCQNVDIPQQNVSKVDLPYQSTTVPKIVPGTSYDRTLRLRFRLDSNYFLYTLLRNSMSTDSKGMYTFNKNNKWSLLVTSLKDTDKLIDNKGLLNFDFLRPSYLWLFKECYLTDVTQLSFSYDSSTNLTCTATFIFERYIDIADVIK